MHHLITLSLLFISPFVSAWDITFYSGENCDHNPDFSSWSYSGSSTDTSWCLQAGEPGHNCEHLTDAGATTDECSEPAEPMPGSFRYSEGSRCCVQIGQDTDCLYKECKYPPPEDCYPTRYMPFKLRGPNYLTFTCGDVDGVDRRRTVNVTQRH
ncbi:hypothetical protein M409DRAFT_27524 [Zasmidium cellare ATCC 36951]|uniref:Uncharacterized protein n=1 Tax=Zasmidium cellare ATCC 36951 TaxID=1080233 RepID=A0A6A6C528_ZASCE|nr:uncharacterized protein M409DRAFT_27524 [Zasmidium cellare ATCC 36951]KAF2162141.1 hypothetical protein M409DRAFT_27524 [Zasmidium cellare ATCC 36951]